MGMKIKCEVVCLDIVIDIYEKRKLKQREKSHSLNTHLGASSNQIFQVKL